jgi:large subunit ribosomal protein L30
MIEDKKKITAIIRISGEVGLKKSIKETLERLRIRRKYSCIIIIPSKEQLGMIKKVKDFVAFGEINEETLKELIEKRGSLLDKKKAKPKTEDIIKGIKENKKLQDFNLKPFVRLHSPRKGIESKKHFGVRKGILGNHKKKINDLIRRML